MTRPRNQMLGSIYDSMLEAARDPASELWYNGKPHRGASHRCAFWDGYLNQRSPLNMPATLASACYKAGQAFAKERPGIEDAGYVRW